MIEDICLKFGLGADSSSLEFSPTAVTVFVGPNYSGKSKVLTEIAARCSSGRAVEGEVILDRIKFQPLCQEDASTLIQRAKVPLRPGEHVAPDQIMVGHRQQRAVLQLSYIQDGLRDPNSNSQSEWLFRFFFGSRTLMLTGQTRLEAIRDQPAGDLQEAPENTFQKLFTDDSLRHQLSSLVHRALGRFLVIDPTKVGDLRLRLSRTSPPAPEVERELGAASVDFHRGATLVRDASDGAKAFIGVLVEILAGDPELLLMDEPEAFLHPSLANMLGQEVATSVSAAGKKAFFATHSPQFLMGCIQSGVSINVIRLTYRDGVATARLLPSQELARLMRNPLLRSTGVLGALFYESVVVTEGDPDRAFYQEINERLLRDGNSRGIPNCTFLNAKNKQTIPTIIAPLRRLGIPTAAIYDIDVIKDGGSTATSVLSSAGIPSLSHSFFGQLRSNLLRALENTHLDYKRGGGITLLNAPECAAAVDYFDQLDRYGAFTVRGGELESWLRHLGIAGHGPAWLVSMFERMGEAPNAPGYLKPSADDVWEFLDRIRAWLLDPQRKGIPA